MLKRFLYFAALLSVVTFFADNTISAQAENALQQTSIIDILGLEGERLERYKEAAERIKSHMADPAQDEYPVIFFDADKIPVLLTAHTKNSIYHGAYPHWLDNRYVIYSAHVQNTATANAVLVLDTVESTFKVIAYSPNDMKRNSICLDPHSRRFSYWALVDKSTDKRGYLKRYGYINDALEFVEELNDSAHPEKLAVNPVTCKPVTELEGMHAGYHPDDMRVSLKKNTDTGQIIWGYFLLHQPDGIIKEINLEWAATHPPYPQYDRTTDRYYMTAVFSRHDRRRKVWWFDREFNIIDQYILPNANMEANATTMMRNPVLKGNGFVLPCSYAGLKNDTPGTLDLWGNQQLSYLCLVKRDQKIIRILEGAVSDLAVSPDGCRVFGLWKPYTVADILKGKNFVADLCIKPKNIKE